MTTTNTQTWNLLNIVTGVTAELGITTLSDTHEILTTLNKANPADRWVAVEA